MDSRRSRKVGIIDAVLPDWRPFATIFGIIAAISGTKSPPAGMVCSFAYQVVTAAALSCLRQLRLWLRPILSLPLGLVELPVNVSFWIEHDCAEVVGKASAVIGE